MKENSHPLMVSIHSLETKIDQLTREFRIRQVQDPGYILLDNADFIQMFKISAKTAQHWREEGLIEVCTGKRKNLLQAYGYQRFYKPS